MALLPKLLFGVVLLLPGGLLAAPLLLLWQRRMARPGRSDVLDT